MASNVAAAIQAHATLAGLLSQHRHSKACLAQIAGLLPASLRAQVRPGPIREGEWTLLISHNAAAAKLRQFQPTLEAAARAYDPLVTSIKLKVSPLETG